MRAVYSSCVLGLLSLLVACAAVEPSSIVNAPRSARAQEPLAMAAVNGTIFQNASYKPMFEDRRARSVGDLITISISEKASADNKGANNSVKVGSMNGTVTGMLGLPLPPTNFLTKSSGNSQFDNKNAGSASYTFLSTIGVTVIEVLPNGNLLVSGEKQIGLDKGVEFIRFSGVISPAVIGQGNVVPSSQVADARIEYRTNTQVDRSQLATLLNRFFYSVVPL